MQARADETRRQILRVALELFSDQGYFNTSVHDIRRVAGVSIGAIYHHFGTKEGVARALYADILDQLDTAIAACINRPGTVEERCKALVGLLFAQTEQAPRLLTFALYARHREFMPEEPPVCSSRPFLRMRELVEAGMAAGEIRSMDPMIAAASLFGGPIRLMQLRLEGVLQQPLPALVEESWVCAWRSVAE